MIDSAAYYYMAQPTTSSYPEKDLVDVLSAFFTACIQWIRDHLPSTSKLTPERVTVVPKQVVLPKNQSLTAETVRVPDEVLTLKALYLPSIDLSDTNYDENFMRRYFKARTRDTTIRNRWVMTATTHLVDPYAKGMARRDADEAILKDIEQQRWADRAWF